MKTIPILIPHFRAEEKLKKCIAHIEAQNYQPVEIFVRDNSEDNILFTAAINEGLYKFAFRDDVDYVLVLNQDAYLGADTLEKLVQCMQANPDCGIACPIQLNDDNSVNWGGSRQVFPFGVHQCDPINSYQDDFETFWSNGAAMLIRTKLVKEIGVFDKNMRFICSDSDYAFTARGRGWKVMVAAQARVRHATGESGASNNEFINQIKCEDAAYFYKKWLSYDIFKDLAFEGKVITETDIAIARLYISGAALTSGQIKLLPEIGANVDIIKSGIKFMAAGFKDLEKYSFDYSLAMNGNSYDAFLMLGKILFEEKKFSDSVEYSIKAIEIKANSSEAYALLGNSMLELQQHEGAVECFNKAIYFNNKNPILYFELGNVYSKLNNKTLAIENYNKALKLNPKLTSAYNNRGVLYQAMLDHNAAIKDFNKAVVISPNHPDAYVNRGNLLREMGLYSAALESLNVAINLVSDRPEFWLNRGAIHLCSNKTELAIADYNQALKIRPNYPEACWNKSVSLLLEGNYSEGWGLFEWRKFVDLKIGVRTFPQPEWDGKASLNGKTIFLYSEQGLGDTIQFARFSKTLEGQGAKVVLGVQPELVEVLRSMSVDFGFVVDGDALPYFDYHCALLSLPGLLGVDESNIPFSDHYLRSDPLMLAAWKKRLGPATQPRVGLVWKGNATQGNDKNRSIPLADLLPHLPVGIEYVCLQKDISQAEALLLSQRPDILRFDQDIHSFSDTAALCESMDLVVSVCTSVAHLSAALGQQTWVLLCFNADWRWLLNRTDSPWYQNVELIRQAQARDWGSVFAKLNAGLISLAQSKQ
jgi:tetratricopeptide (TPR) repeat protein